LNALPQRLSQHHSLWRTFFAPSVRHIESSESCIYLTFDDGPDPESTPAVLDLLRKHGVAATFFLIANKAHRYPQLSSRIVSEGHSVGNHSLDHRYGVFFSGRKTMIRWIQEAQAVFKGLGIETIGFRPPAGVRTPELHRALSELEIPLILWEKRFFDRTLKWTSIRARRSLRTTRPGAIVLLHDRQPQQRLANFLETLDDYILTAKKQGLNFQALTATRLKVIDHAVHQPPELKSR
jgi:peptidoglycan/xylan/chitin deacetylase (PgdA/CDA1 family)